MLRRFWHNYVQRHQHITNQRLHIVGVPLTFIGTPVLIAAELPGWAIAALCGGYVLQFVGHAFEGNDAGEVILFKKLLGRPYREFGRDVNALNPVVRSVDNECRDSAA